MTLTSKDASQPEPAEARSQSLPRGLHVTAKLALRIPTVIQRPQPRPSLVFSRSAAARDCNVVCRCNRPLGAQLSRLTSPGSSTSYRNLPSDSALFTLSQSSHPSLPPFAESFIHHCCSPHRTVRLASPLTSIAPTQPLVIAFRSFWILYCRNHNSTLSSSFSPALCVHNSCLRSSVSAIVAYGRFSGRRSLAAPASERRLSSSGALHSPPA